MSTRRHVLAAASAAILATGWSGFTRAETTLLLSHIQQTTHVIHQASERIAEEVARRTDGELVIEIRPNSQLFNLRESAEALQLGTLDLAWAEMATLSQWVPHLAFTFLPFVISDREHAARVLYGPAGDEARQEILDQLDIETLSFGIGGFRVFLTKEPITSVEDFAGKRLRVPEIPVLVDMASALGASPTPIPGGEVYTALRTGVVDGMESPPDFILSQNHYEVAGYATRTNHIFNETTLFGSKSRLDALPPEHRQVLFDVASEVIQGWYNEQNGRIVEEAWNELASKTQADGQPDLAAMRERMGPVIEEWVRKVGPRGQHYVELMEEAR